MDEYRSELETMNAVIDGLGALVFAVVHELPPERRASFAVTLARLAGNAEREGQMATETLLIDLHRAAMAAA